MTDRESRESSAPEDRFRALAFTGGFDAVVQLGLVHALLVSSGCAPDAVVWRLRRGGQCRGASRDTPGGQQSQARVDKLRKFLDSYLQVPGEILRSILPDAFEINAIRPLKPIELPIHFQEEREDRELASRLLMGSKLRAKQAVRIAAHGAPPHAGH